MAKQYIGVRKGHRPGVYRGYEAAHPHVYRYPGALYQGFSTYEEAEAYVRGASGDAVEMRIGGRVARIPLGLDLHTDLIGARLDPLDGDSSAADLAAAAAAALMSTLLAAGLHANGGAAGVLKMVSEAEASGQLSSASAEGYRYVVRMVCDEASD